MKMIKPIVLSKKTVQHEIVSRKHKGNIYRMISFPRANLIPLTILPEGGINK